MVLCSLDIFSTSQICLQVQFKIVMMSGETCSLEAILREHSSLVVLPSGKVRCELTGHEMPPLPALVSKHISSAKFHKLCSAKQIFDDNQEIFEDEGDHYLCKVTEKHIVKDGAALRRHLDGKKFKHYSSKLQQEAENQVEPEANLSDDELDNGDLVDSTDLAAMDTAEFADDNEKQGMRKKRKMKSAEAGSSLTLTGTGRGPKRKR